MKKINEPARLSTFGGANDVAAAPRATIALTAAQWGAVSLAVHHGFEAVLRRTDIPIIAQSAFSKDIESAMSEISAVLKRKASK